MGFFCSVQFFFFFFTNLDKNNINMKLLDYHHSTKHSHQMINKSMDGVDAQKSASRKVGEKGREERRRRKRRKERGGAFGQRQGEGVFHPNININCREKIKINKIILYQDPSLFFVFRFLFPNVPSFISFPLYFFPPFLPMHKRKFLFQSLAILQETIQLGCWYAQKKLLKKKKKKKKKKK